MNDVREAADRIIAASRGTPAVQALEPAALSAYGTGRIQHQIACGGAFVATHLLAKSTGRFHSRIKGPGGAYLDSDKVRDELLWGQGIKHRIPPKAFQSGSNITVELEDRSNAANTVRLYLFGFRVEEDSPAFKAWAPEDRGLFVQTTPASSADGASTVGGVSIAANDTRDGSITFQRGGHCLRVQSVNAKGTSDSWRGTWRHADIRQSAAEGLSSNDRRIDSSALVGVAPTSAGLRPGELPTSLIWAPQRSLVLSLEDYSGATNVVHWAFIGELLPSDPGQW